MAKKIISIVLSVIFAFSAFAICSFAGDTITAEDRELYPDEELAFEMAYSLIDIENCSSSLNQRKGVVDSLETCIQKTFYKNEEDATEFYLNQVRRKKDFGGKYNEKALDSSYDEVSDDEDEMDED